MGKSSSSDRNGLKKGPWTAEEDQILIDYIQKHGQGRWRLLPKNAGLRRCGKSCRLRWTNYLRPDIKRGKFSSEEEETIIQMHSVLGNKWSAIATRLPGRTDNEIKNYWNTHIRKKLFRMGIDPVTHKPRLDLLQLYSLVNSSQITLPSNLLGIIGSNMLNLSQLNLAANSLFTPSQSNIMQFPNQIQSLNETQYMQSAQMVTNCSSQNAWQTGGKSYFMGENLASNCGLYEEDDEMSNMKTSSFESLSNYVGGGLNSLMSTPSCTATPLQSSSTTNYVNGCIEDERDSYCSNNLLMFDLPNSLDVNGLM